MERNMSSSTSSSTTPKSSSSASALLSRQQSSNNTNTNNANTATNNSSITPNASVSNNNNNSNKRKMNHRTIIGYIHIRQLGEKGLQVIQPYHKPIEQIILSNTTTPILIQSETTNNGKTKSATTTESQTTTLIPCPLCPTNNSSSSVGATINHLWSHLYDAHRETYDFTVGIPEDGLVHIGALEKRSNDIRYKCNPPVMERDYKKVIQNNNTSYKPERQYYHYGTLEKIPPHEYIMGIDCEEDRYMDRTWEHELKQDATREFVDLSIAEFDFCTLWNRFLLNNPVMIRAELPSRFLEFAIECVNYIVELQDPPPDTTPTNGSSVASKDKYDIMIEEFTLFALSRWDEGEVSRSHVEYILDLFNTLIEAKRKTQN